MPPPERDERRRGDDGSEPAHFGEPERLTALDDRRERHHGSRLYCQLWVRCYDYHTIPDVAQRCTPRQRRLLGDLGYDFMPGSYFYVPKDQEEVIGAA